MVASDEMFSECLLASQSPRRQNCGADILSARSHRDTSNSSNTSCANEIIYCGYRLDSESQLYYVRNRTYNAVLGRWIQRDPIGYDGGINLYQVVGSGPVGAVDPNGLGRKPADALPNDGTPNSIGERVGPDGKVVTRGFYNDKGKLVNRQDYAGGGDQGNPTPHEHVKEFNQRGQRTGEVCNKLDPNTVDRTPGSGVKASPAKDAPTVSESPEAKPPSTGVGTEIENAADDAAGDLGRVFSDLLFPIQITIIELQTGGSPPQNDGTTPG